ISEPPSCVSGSKTPFTVAPKRVTSRLLPPPTPPALWHSPQERPLKTGPRPSATVSTLTNSERPSLNAASSVDERPLSGLPNSACCGGCGCCCGGCGGAGGGVVGRRCANSGMLMARKRKGATTRAFIGELLSSRDGRSPRSRDGYGGARRL